MADEYPPEPMPLPFGVKASGELLNPLQPDDWQSMAAPVRVRPRADHLVFAEGVDPANLASAGWGVVFARDADPAIREALQPLLAHRRAQVNSALLYQEFDGARAVRASESARGWVTRQGADFMEVEPANGVPLYLLLVGSPAAIPFEFQYAVDSYWNVGRLDFDTPAEYAAYASHVIAYEQSATVANRRRAVLWNPKNPGDQATGLLHNLVAQPLQASLGARAWLAEAATKSALLDVLRGAGGPPAVLFTGSHGVAFPEASEPQRRELQGALLCQEWSAGQPVTEQHYVSGAEVLAEANVSGLIHLLFACYGGGCPATDNYQRSLPLFTQPITARLPQAMLQKGALAVLAHVDRAWSYSFQSLSGKGQAQSFRSVLDRLLNGERIGQATDSFNQRWGALSNELLDLTRRHQDDPASVPDSVLTNRWVARNDARNYLILGDPAVRLRIADMQS
ncbi:MAG: hypothetical protein K2X03_31455 [Bryobacteraceae bacterium]|nr:hypothetical protein [Bryobacteraceae bacterium]